MVTNVVVGSNRGLKGRDLFFAVRFGREVGREQLGEGERAAGCRGGTRNLQEGAICGGGVRGGGEGGGGGKLISR